MYGGSVGTVKTPVSEESILTWAEIEIFARLNEFEGIFSESVLPAQSPCAHLLFPQISNLNQLYRHSYYQFFYLRKAVLKNTIVCGDAVIESVLSARAGHIKRSGRK